jgi:hypothetical protein
MDTLQVLPHDVLHIVFGFLSTDERAVAAQVCRDFRAVCESHALRREVSFSPRVAERMTGAQVVALCARVGRGVTSVDLRRALQLSEDELCAVIAATGPALERLHTGPVSITAQTLGALAHSCPRLRALAAGDNPEADVFELTSAAIGAFARACPSLRALHFGALRFTDAGLAEVAQALPNLASLRMLAPLVSSEGIAHMAKHLPALEHLALYVSAPLNCSAVQALGTHCPRLRSLKARMQTRGLQALQSPALESLDVSESKWITDAAFADLAKGCPRITEIRAAACPLLSNSCLPVLAALPLRRLDVQGSAISAWPAFLAHGWITRAIPSLEVVVLKRGALVHVSTPHTGKPRSYLGTLLSRKREMHASLCSSSSPFSSSSSQSPSPRTASPPSWGTQLLREVLPPFGASVLLYCAAAACASY